MPGSPWPHTPTWLYGPVSRKPRDQLLRPQVHLKVWYQYLLPVPGPASLILTHNIQSYLLDNCRGEIVPGDTQIVSAVPPRHRAQLEDRADWLVLTAPVLEVDPPPVRSPPGDGGFWLPPGLAEHPACSSTEKPLLTLTGVEEHRGSHHVERNLLSCHLKNQYFTLTIRETWSNELNLLSDCF